MGIDFGTESVRVGAFDMAGTPVAMASRSYPLHHPRAGWAEQNPADWWAALVAATNEVMRAGKVSKQDIVGLGADTTSCTVVPMDGRFRPLRPAILWMDVRAASQAHRIAETGHPALKYNGFGPVSAEWMPCKALWLKENEPETYQQATHFGECLDWLTHRLTGEWVASINTTSIRWYYDRATGGWPHTFYEQAGLGDLVDRFSSRVLDMGTVSGQLQAPVADELGLPAGIPVAEGGADAFVAMIGLNVVQPGKMAFITGSSHLNLGQSGNPLTARGIFGAYTDAVIPGQFTVEGGQVSTGSVVKWFRDNFCAREVEEAARRGVDTYAILDEMAGKVPLGSEGLMVLDYWQGNRTPYVDPEARGIIWGLTLRHTTGHLFRAILEGIAYGTEHILRTMRQHGFVAEEMVACGGPTRSRLWMQIHADVSNLPISFTAVPDGPALGSAILGAVAANCYPDIATAAQAMVHETSRIEPDPALHEQYRFYVDQYIATYPQMREIIHANVRHMA
jgi:FGGY-family pentulose kinase